MLSQVLCVTGTVLLLHAGYSANQYKTLLYAQGQESNSSLPPLDVLLECALSFVLILIGQLLPLTLESIQLSPSKKFTTFADRFGAPEYIRFDHRGPEFQRRINRKNGSRK